MQASTTVFSQHDRILLYQLTYLNLTKTLLGLARETQTGEPQTAHPTDAGSSIV